MSQYDPEPPGGPGNAPPPPSYSGPTTTEAPKPVRQAVTLLFVLIALNVLNAIVTLTSSDAQTVGGGIFGTVVFIALYTWLTLMVRNGKNWARITITVLFVLGILLSLVTFALAVPAILKLLTALQLIVQIAILVLLFSRPSKEYFAAAR